MQFTGGQQRIHHRGPVLQGADNTGTQIGSLWTPRAALLAAGTFTNETAAGWQELDFSAPVAVTAGTTYVASYFRPDGALRGHPERAGVGGDQRAADRAGRRRGLLPTARRATFPTSTYRRRTTGSMWSTRPAGGTARGGEVTRVAGASSNAVSVGADGDVLAAGDAQHGVVHGERAPAGTRWPGTGGSTARTRWRRSRRRDSLAASTTYTVTVSGAQECLRAADEQPSIRSPPAPARWGQCPCRIWQDGTPTGSTDAADTSPVSWGCSSRRPAAGSISGVRFYKESDNTGTHTGSLWTSSGTLLATGTFTNETA